MDMFQYDFRESKDNISVIELSAESIVQTAATPTPSLPSLIQVKEYIGSPHPPAPPAHTNLGNHLPYLNKAGIFKKSIRG